MISMFLTCLVLIFVGFGIAEAFSSWFDSRAAGYFAASGVFVVFIVVVALCRRAIMSALAGVFVKMMTDDEDGDDAEDKDGNEITN